MLGLRFVRGLSLVAASGGSLLLSGKCCFIYIGNSKVNGNKQWTECHSGDLKGVNATSQVD